MTATFADGELEIAGSAAEWEALAALLESHGAALACERGGLRWIAVRAEERAALRISVEGDDAVFAGSPAHLERFGRTAREFGAKSRLGQTAVIESLGPEHYIDPASVLTIFRLSGEAAGRKDDLGG